jgi:hypothetical protein
MTKNISGKSIENADEIKFKAILINIFNIRMPLLMRFSRLVETIAFG